MANKVLIGHDVSAWVVTGGGFDSLTNTFSGGASYNYFGRWENIEFTLSTKWFVVTSSDAGIEERRAGPSDWKASLSNMIRQDVGATGISLILQNQYIALQFTETSSGRVMNAIGGIESTTATYAQEAAKEKIEVVNVGSAPTYA